MKYDSVRITDIIEDINRLYFLPDIQREFVWGPGMVAKLFDSIMNDFPIGSFLLWNVLSEHKNDWNSYEFIKNYDKENPHNEPIEIHGDKDIFLVLDGQQRLTSLFIGLKGSFRYFHYRWRKTQLYLNLLKPPIPNEDDPEELTYEFKFLEDVPTNNGETEFWYKVGKILDFAEAAYAKLDIKDDISHLTESQKINVEVLIERLHNKIHTLPTINYFAEKSQDPERVLNIFVRANTEGKKLEYSDLLLSTATAKWDRLNAREEMNRFVDEINRIGSGYGFGKDFVLKSSLYLTEDLPIQYKVKNFTKPNLLKIEDNWDNIKTYLDSTINLVSKYGFTSKNITAPITLLPIAFFIMKSGNKDFFKSSEKEDVKNQIMIRRWLISAFLKNAFGSSSDTKLKNVRDVFIKNDTKNGFPLNDINGVLEIEDKFRDTEISEMLNYNYQTRYSFLILSLLYPNRDWKDTIFHEDHIFPKSSFHLSILKKRGYSKEKIEYYLKHYNTILNLQLLADSENLGKNATPFDEWIKTRDEGFKSRHLIPEMEDYDLDYFQDFIEQRKTKLTEVFQRI